MKDPYQVLEVDRQATTEDIKRAYRKKAKTCHPDLHPKDEEAAERFKELNDAYSILSDEKKRQMYDTYGEAAFSNGGGGSDFGGFADFDVSDLFGDVFGSMFGRRTSRRADPNAPQRGNDIQLEVHLTFKEAVFGCKKKIKIRREVNCSVCHGVGAKNASDRKTCPTCHGSGVVNRTQDSILGRMVHTVTCPTCSGKGYVIENPCPHCHGTGREDKTTEIMVNIPAGIDTGNILPVRGQGDEGKNGGPAGDVYLTFFVQSHPIFQRERNDIFFEVPISFTQAALGGKLEIPTLNGTKEVHIPEGTQTGRIFTLKGEGIPDVRTGKKGNLSYQVNIVTPKKLSAEQKDALRKYAEVSGESVHETKKNFFDKVKDFFE